MQKYRGNAPDWFKLSKYLPLKEYNSKQLCIEMAIRMMQLERVKYPTKIIEGKSILNYLKYDNEQILKLTKKTLFSATREKCLLRETLIDWNNDVLDYYDLSHKERLLDKRTLIHDELFWSEYPFMKNYTRDICLFGNAEKSEHPLSPLKSYNIAQHYFVPEEVLNIYNKAIRETGEINLRNKNKLKKYIESESSKYKVENYYPKNNVLMDSTYLGELSLDDEMFLIVELFSNTVFDQFIPKISSDSLITLIDVTKPNDVLIRDLLKLVDERRKLNPNLNKFVEIKEQNKKNGGMGEIKTLIEQRVFQYLDLYMWNMENCQESTNSWYISKIFSDIPRSEPIPDGKLNETIKPCAKRWSNDNWLNSFYHFDIPAYNEFKNN